MTADNSQETSFQETSLTWHWQGVPVSIGMTRAGRGPSLLLVPAPSSISTREEMRPLQALLAKHFETLAIDLPGFGTASKPKLAWRPETYRAFLADMLAKFKPDATVAAGHAASYALAVAATNPGSTGRLALLAPSWRGPLPTVLGKRPAWLARLAGLADVPLVGSLLYRLNINPPMIRMMGRGHVYGDPNWLAGARLASKLAVTREKGARHASVRFVCGELDLLQSREEWLALAGKLPDETLVIYGSETPRRSRGEVEALLALPHMRGVAIPGGKLAVHEEFAAETAAALLPFLDGLPARPAASAA